MQERRKRGFEFGSQKTINGKGVETRQQGVRIVTAVLFLHSYFPDSDPFLAPRFPNSIRFGQYQKNVRIVSVIGIPRRRSGGTWRRWIQYPTSRFPLAREAQNVLGYPVINDHRCYQIRRVRQDLRPMLIERSRIARTECGHRHSFGILLVREEHRQVFRFDVT